MIILDATTKKIEIVLGGSVSTNEVRFDAKWADVQTGNPRPVPASSNGVSTGTTAKTVVAAPAASTQRIVSEINIQQNDTASVSLTIQIDSSGTDYVLWSGTLAAGKTYSYSALGMRSIDNTGSLQ